MTRLIIIIPAEILTAVQAEGGGAFVAAGSPTGNTPATHWWQSGRMNDDEVAKVTALYVSFPEARVENYSRRREPERPWELLEEMGLKPLTVNFP